MAAAQINFNPALTQLLSAEVMVAILQEVDPHDAHRCCWVSRRWRALALKTKHCLFDCATGVTFEELIELPVVMHQLACPQHKSTPRSVEVDLHLLDNHPNEKSALLDALAKILPSIRCLTLFAEPGVDDDDVFELLAKPAPALAELSLTFYDLSTSYYPLPVEFDLPEVPHLFAGQCPLLTTVYLDDVKFPSIPTFPLPQVTVARFTTHRALQEFPSWLEAHFPGLDTLDIDAPVLARMPASTLGLPTLNAFMAQLTRLVTSPKVLEALLETVPATAQIKHIELAQRGAHTSTTQLFLPHLIHQGTGIQLAFRTCGDEHVSVRLQAGRPDIITRSYTISSQSLPNPSFWNPVTTSVFHGAHPFLRVVSLTVPASCFTALWAVLPLGASLQHLHVHCENGPVDLPMASHPRRLVGLADVSIDRYPFSPFPHIRFSTVSKFLISLVGREAALKLNVVFHGFKSVVHGGRNPRRADVRSLKIKDGRLDYNVECAYLARVRTLG